MQVKATCHTKGHSNKPLTLICTHPKCQNNHLLCSKCLSLHKDCLDHILDIEGVLKRSFVDNINWIKDNEIKQAVFLIDEYKLLGGKKQLFEIYEELIDKEFEKLIQAFIEKVKETKARMLVNAKQLYDATKIDLEGFKTHLESLYNFDVLVGILEPLENDLDDFGTVNMQLNHFFQEISSRKVEEKNLKEMGKTLNAYARQFLEIDRRPFSEFLEQIPFHNFDTYPCNMWTWDIKRKSKSILLCEDNTVAKKQPEPSVRPTAVLGSREFSRGLHDWEVSVASGREDHDWICFGVIETHLVKDLDALPSADAIRLSTVGHPCQLEIVKTLGNYDNKTYLCNLDLESGTFTISYQGHVVAKEQNNLKGKTVVPFVSVKYPGNVAKLKVIRSL